MKHFKGLFLGAILFLVSAVSAICPPEEDVAPCSCSNVTTFNELECQGKEISLEQVEKSLDAMDKNEGIILVLTEIELRWVPANFFAGFPIKHIELHRCYVDSLTVDGKKPFEGLEDSLMGVEIISVFKDANFPLDKDKININHLKRLQELHLFDNIIFKMDNTWFSEELPSLHRVMLSRNDIEIVGDKAFQNLKNLNVLYLNDNRFGNVKRSMFPDPALMLQEIELENNALTSLPEDLFSNMPLLMKISLRSNGLTTIKQIVFAPMWSKLQWVDFRDNSIQCNSDIEWITKQTRPDYLLGECEGPHDKKGDKLEDLAEAHPTESSL